MRYVFLSIFLCCNVLVNNAFSQFRQPQFQICKTPAIIGHRLIDSVNLLIAAVPKRADALSIINAALKNKRYKGTLITMQEITGKNSYRILQFYLGNSTHADEKMLTRTVSRGQDETIYYTRDFKSSLKGRVCLLDTLRISIILYDEPYPLEQYYLLMENGLRQRSRISLPVDANGKLQVFASPMEPQTKPSDWKCELFNKAGTGSLASFGLHICTLDEKNQLRQQIRLLLSMNGKEIASNRSLMVPYLLLFAEASIGTIKNSDLEAWLNRQKFQ